MNGYYNYEQEHLKLKLKLKHKGKYLDLIEQNLIEERIIFIEEILCSVGRWFYAL